MDIDVGLFTEPDDLTRLRDGIESACEITYTAPFADYAGAERTTGNVIETVSVYQHPVGTCRMGPSTDPAAVVDPRGAVHGIDASIIRRIPAANTNFPRS